MIGFGLFLGLCAGLVFSAIIYTDTMWIGAVMALGLVGAFWAWMMKAFSGGDE